MCDGDHAAQSCCGGGGGGGLLPVSWLTETEADRKADACC